MGKFEKPRRTSQQSAAEKASAAHKRVSAKPSSAQKKASGTGRKKPGNGKIAALVAAAVVCLAVLGVAVYAYVLHSSGNIFPNVYVAGVNVGGMSQEEAAAAVQAAVDKTYGTATLTVQLPDRTLSFAPADTQVTLDVDKAVEAARAAGETPYVIGRIEAGEKGVELC